MKVKKLVALLPLTAIRPVEANAPAPRAVAPPPSPPNVAATRTGSAFMPHSDPLGPALQMPELSGPRAPLPLPDFWDLPKPQAAAEASWPKLNSAEMRKLEASFRRSMRPREVVLLSGPGGLAFGAEDVSSLQAGLALQTPAVTLGDGQRDVRMAELFDAVTSSANEGRRPVIFIHAHGKMDNGHLVRLGRGDSQRTDELFRTVAEATAGAPVDIFLTSCHGGGAILDGLKTLPHGSTLTTLSSAEDPVFVQDIVRLTTALNSLPVNLEKPNELAILYLVKGLGNRVSPSLAFPGFGAINLDSTLEQRLGKTFTRDEAARAHERLDPLMGHAETSDFIERIQTAATIWDFKWSDYGPALAVTLAAI
jgi:hypothetical protein